MRRGRLELTGALTEAALEMFAGDITFQGAAGISLDGIIGAAFALDSPPVRRELIRTLERRNIGLCAHHLQFEDMWSRRALGAVPDNWVWAFYPRR